MGLDYNFNIVLEKDKLEEAISWIKKEAKEFTETEESNAQINANLILQLKSDPFLEEYYQTRFKASDSAFFKIGTNQWTLGYIHFFINKTDEIEEVELCFMASTSGMSRLFAKSDSVIDFFREMSIQLNAKYCYLDMEAEGRKEIMSA